MPGPKGELSVYLKKALKNLVRLQNMEMDAEYGKVKRVSEMFRNDLEGGLRSFLDDQYRRHDPVYRIELLRNEAMSYTVYQDSEKAKQMEGVNKDKVENCIDQLLKMLERGESLENYYFMAKRKKDAKPEDLAKYTSAAYDVITALFSIASMCQYVDPSDIMYRMAKAATQPIAPIAETTEKQEAFVLFVAQNIRAVVDMITTKATIDAAAQKQQANPQDPQNPQDVAELDRQKRQRKALSTGAINAIRLLKSTSATSMKLFDEVKQKYSEDHDWTKMSNSLMDVVSLNLDEVDICNDAIEVYALPELFDKEHFGDALISMYIIDTMGEVKIDDLMAAMTGLYHTASRVWTKMYDPYDKSQSKSVLKEKKQEYMTKALPQFNLAILAFFKIMKKHDDKKENLQKFLELATRFNPYVSMKYYEMLAFIEGKEPKQIYDILVEKYKGMEDNYAGKCDMISIMFQSLVYCPDTMDEKIAAMADMVIAETYYPGLREEYASGLMENIISRKSTFLGKKDECDKLAKNLTDMMLKDSSLCQGIAMGFNEYVKEHNTAEDWAEGSLNNIFFKIMVDYRVKAYDMRGTQVPYRFEVWMNEMMTLKLINSASADEFMTAIKPLTDAIDKGATVLKSILRANCVLDSNVQKSFRKAVEDNGKADMCITVFFKLMAQETQTLSKRPFMIESQQMMGEQFLYILLKKIKGKDNYNALWEKAKTLEPNSTTYKFPDDEFFSKTAMDNNRMRIRYNLQKEDYESVWKKSSLADQFETFF